MKAKTVLLILFNLVIILTTTQSLASVSQGVPEIRFEATTHDFGTIYPREKANHVFRFTNVGEGELQISKVTNACKCTVILLSAAKLAPGEEGEIAVTFDAGDSLGKLSRSIYVHTNDPKHEITQLQIEVFIGAPAVITPEKIVLGKVKQGEEIERTATITQAGREELEIVTADSTSEYLKTTFHPAEGNPPRYEIKATLSPEAPAGIIREYLTVLTTSNIHPLYEIPVEGEIITDAVIAPPPNPPVPEVVPKGRVSIPTQVAINNLLRITFFYAADCEDCQAIESELFPRLAEDFPGQFEIIYYELNDLKNYQKLIEYEERYDDQDNEMPVIFVGERVLGGKEEIWRDLIPVVGEILGEEPAATLKNFNSSRKDVNTPASSEETELSEAKAVSYLAYFSKEGCRKCRRVEYTLRDLRAR